MINHRDTDRGKEIKALLDEVSVVAVTLNQWELQFFESVSNQFESRQDLSDKQLEILKKIYKERVNLDFS